MDLKQLILIRHGELPPEYAGRFVGSTDAPLGEKGMEDCRALAGIWKEMNSEVTFVSPKLRARQTAELVCGDGEIQLDDRLREVDFGRWETLNFEEIAGRDPEYSKYWYDHPQEIHFPEGESVPDFYARVEAFTEMLLKDPHREMTVISHGGVLTVMIFSLPNMTIRGYNLRQSLAASARTFNKVKFMSVFLTMGIYTLVTIIPLVGNALLVHFFRYPGHQIVSWILSLVWYYLCFLVLPSYIYAMYFDAEDMERADLNEGKFIELG